MIKLWGNCKSFVVCRSDRPIFAPSQNNKVNKSQSFRSCACTEPIRNVHGIVNVFAGLTCSSTFATNISSIVWCLCLLLQNFITSPAIACADFKDSTSPVLCWCSLNNPNISAHVYFYGATVTVFVHDVVSGSRSFSLALFLSNKKPPQDDYDRSIFARAPLILQLQLPMAMLK